MNQEPQISGIQEHLQTYIDKGFILDDKRFLYVKAWVYLLMQLNDALLSIELAQCTEKYEEKSTVKEVLIQQSLFRNAVINYAKCFSSSGRGRISLDKKKVYAKDVEMLAQHEKLMNIRNKFSAHNDGAGIDAVNIAIKEEFDNIAVAHLYTVVNPISDYDSYQELFLYCSKHVTICINRALDKIQKDTGKLISLDC